MSKAIRRGTRKSVKERVRELVWSEAATNVLWHALSGSAQLVTFDMHDEVNDKTESSLVLVEEQMARKALDGR
jgi:hypothetical protein